MNEAAERARRWRLLLGADGDTGATLRGGGPSFDLERDKSLEALYDAERRGGLGGSAPKVARWLGDVREYFPQSVVKVLQQDAIDRLGLRQLLMEPELLQDVEPDVQLVGTLLSLRSALPEKTRETARIVVGKVVAEIEERLQARLQSAVTGALDRQQRTRRPRIQDVDWDATIRANLKNYQPAQNTLVVDTLIGGKRAARRAALQDVIICVDQSGSMASSVVYAGVLAAAMASLKSVSTKMVVFDTNVVDLSPLLADPVDVLFGTQLGGGTDIDKALAYCEGLVTRPEETVLVLVSDLYEGGNQASMLRRAHRLVESGVNMVALLALSDDGAPYYSAQVAEAYRTMGIPTFACTPDLFPDVMAAALKREDLGRWASANDE